MPNRLPLISLFFFALALVALPSPASAGFQWVAPSDNTPLPPVTVIQASPSPRPAPVTTVVPTSHTATAAPEIISPVIISGNTAPVPSVAPLPASSAPAAEVVDVSSNVNAPVVRTPVVGGRPANSGMLLAPVAATSASPDVVHGFAKQVPLAVALRQILPAGYGFSVDPDVDLGVLISFQGGKPWRETLRDALEPPGLVMHEQGQMVSVGRAGAMTLTQAPPMAAPMSITPRPAPRMVEMNSNVGGPIVAPSAVAMPQPMDAGGPVAEQWRADRGDNLHKIMEAWAARAHVELNWVAEYDYPLQASYNYTGTFEDAVRNLLTGFEDAHPQPIAELHANPGLGQKVLVVQTRGNSYSD